RLLPAIVDHVLRGEAGRDVVEADQAERALAELAHEARGRADVEVDALLLHQILADGNGDARGILADDRRNVVDGDELLGRVERRGRAAAGILDDDVELAAEDAAGGVDLLHRQLDAAALVVADGGAGAGKRQDRADGDGGGLRDDGRGREQRS